MAITARPGLVSGNTITSAFANDLAGMLVGLPFNVMDSDWSGGAIGDGSTNDTTPVAAAIAAIAALGRPGALVFPPGFDFSIGELTLAPEVTGITAYGAIIRHRAVGAGFGLFSTQTATGLGPFVVQGGHFIGVAGDALHQSDSAFYIETAGQTIGDIQDIVFRDCIFEDFRGYPIRVGYVRSILLDNCTFRNCSIGPNLYSSRPPIVRHCTFDGQQYTGTSTTPALAFNVYPYPADETSDDQMRGLQIVGCTFKTITKHQTILGHGAMYGVIADNTFEDCNAPISLHTDGASGSFQGHRDLVIHHNVMNGTDAYGSASVGDLHTHGGVEVDWNHAIEVTGSTDSIARRVKIDANIIRHYGHAAEAGGAADSLNVGAIASFGFTTELEITHNLITDCYGAGMRLQGSHLDLKIAGNTIRDILNPSGQQGAGLRLLDGSPTGKVFTGDIRNNDFDTMTNGIAATQTTPDFSALRFHGDNRFRAVTTPWTTGTNANRLRTPEMYWDTTPVPVDAAVTDLVFTGVNSAMTISTPTNPHGGKLLSVLVYNFGSLGTITWPASFKFASAWSNPASSQYIQITFRYENLNARWNEVSRTASYA